MVFWQPNGCAALIKISAVDATQTPVLPVSWISRVVRGSEFLGFFPVKRHRCGLSVLVKDLILQGW